MASIDFASLTTPLSGAEPCGPDLDLEYDDDYMNFVANIEGSMPTTFFVENPATGSVQPFAFDSSVLKVDDALAKIVAFLGRTRDLRLMTLMARLMVLSRDIQGFSSAVEAIATLLSAMWDEVHPRAEDGAFTMRAATLGTLSETTIVFSLQYARLCDSRRAGSISFRSYMFTQGEAEPREGEETPVEATIVQALQDNKEQSFQTRDNLEKLRAALARINELWVEKADFMSAPRFSAIDALALRIIGLIDLAYPREVASAVASLDGGDGPRTGAVSSAAQAVAALQASMDYFMQREPSSPLLPLIAQAQQLLGKSFVEVLQTLLPDHVGSAAYQIGNRQYFPLPVERLAGLLPNAAAYGDTQASDAEEETAPISSDEPEEAAANDGGETSGDAEAGPDEASDAEHFAPASNAGTVAVRVQPATRMESGFSAASRAQALGLLDAVAGWLRTAEPSSPVPWLLERARALADRDFLTVLKAVLPPNALSEQE